MSGRSIRVYLNPTQRKIYAGLRNQIRDFIDNAERYSNLQGKPDVPSRGILNEDYQFLALCYVLRHSLAHESSYSKAEYEDVADWQRMTSIVRKVADSGLTGDDLSTLREIVNRLYPDAYTYLLLSDSHKLSEMRGQVIARWYRVRTKEAAERYRKLRDAHGDSYGYRNRPHGSIGSRFSPVSTPVDIGIDFSSTEDDTVVVRLGRVTPHPVGTRRVVNPFHQVRLLPASSKMIMDYSRAVEVVQRHVHPKAHLPLMEAILSVNKDRQTYLGHLMCAYYSMRCGIPVSPRDGSHAPHTSFCPDRSIVFLQSNVHPKNTGLTTKSFNEVELVNSIIETYTLLAVFPQISLMDTTK